MTDDTVVWQGPDDLRPFLQPLDAVQLHPENPRQGDVGAMVESVQAFGQYRLAVVQRSTGYVCAGNHLHRALAALGWTHIAVLPRDLTDTQARQLMLADNRVADRGTYDQQALADVLQALAESGDLVPGTGYDLDDVDDLLAELQRTPVLPPSGTSAEQVAGGDEATRRQQNAEARPGFRDVKLMVPQSEWGWFSEAVQVLRKAYGVDGITDVLMRAVSNEAARVARDTEAEA